MTRTFIETPTFTRNWQKLGLSDDDLRVLQETILKDPKTAGDVIPNSGGLRKIRISAKGHGKRGGARVIYVDVEVKDVVYLINVYAKNEQTNLSPAETIALRGVVQVLKEE